MSYDLTFYSIKDKAPSLDKCSSFFAARENFKVENNYFNYENEKTGVYFYFSFHEPTEESSADDEREIPDKFALSGLYFNINYCRSPFFIHEAAIEIEALCKHFALYVDNPQGKAEAEEFNKQDIIDTWQKSNQWATKAMAQMGSTGQKFFLEHDKLIEFWQYAYTREYVQDYVMGENVFYPSLYLGLHQDQPKRAQRWYMFQANLKTTIPADAEFAMVVDHSDFSNMDLAVFGKMVPHATVLDFLGITPDKRKTTNTQIPGVKIGYYSYKTSQRKDFMRKVIDGGFESGKTGIQKMHPSLAIDVEV